MQNLLFAILVFASSFALASSGGSTTLGNLEFRIMLGQQSAKPDSFNESMETYYTDNPDIGRMKSNSIDLLWRFDSKPIVAGLRYDILDFDKGDNATRGGQLVATQTKLKGSRLNAMAGWRFFQNASGYGGLLATVPVMQSLKYTIDSVSTVNGGTTSFVFNGKPETGFSVGIDGGVVLEKTFTVGIEVGYMSFVTKKFEDDAGAEILDANSKAMEMDLSGMYYRFGVGFTFF